MAKEITMRAGNKGLTVKINLWSLEKYLDDYDADSARLCIKGMATNAGTKEEKFFNDAGELLTTLGKWNRDKLKELKKAAKVGR